MTKNIALSRPATSAIAAFLALSTSAFAQEAPTITMTPPVVESTTPAPQTPPTVAAPSTPAPVAAPQTAAPAPVIRVPLDIAPVETTAAPEATQRTAPAVSARAARTPARTAERARPVAAAPVAVAAAPASVADTAPIADMTPIAAPMAAPAEPVVAAPLPAETATAAGGAFPWEIVGGAAALLIVGGAGLAFARRRRQAAVAYEAPVQRYEPVEAAAPVTSDAQSWITPAYGPHASTTPAPRTTPAFAAAPSGSMGRHEAMAMAGPTPDNPFATLSKRLKRARFRDRQERIAYNDTLAAQQDMSRKPISAWDIAQRPAPPLPQQEVHRPEPARGRSGELRPGFARP